MARLIVLSHAHSHVSPMFQVLQTNSEDSQQNVNTLVCHTRVFMIWPYPYPQLSHLLSLHLALSHKSHPVIYRKQRCRTPQFLHTCLSSTRNDLSSFCLPNAHPPHLPATLSLRTASSEPHHLQAASHVLLYWSS